jgi:hypothetical protein
MHIEPQSARFTVESVPGGIKATVPARRNWLVLIFLCAWSVGWVFGETHAIRALASPSENSSQLFMLVWLVGWTIGGGFVAATILWQLAGKEVLSINPTLFEHRVEAFGLGRTRSYKKTEIKNLRATEYSSNPFTNQTAMLPPLTGAGYGPVAFDYGARTFRMAPALEEAEAKLLVEKLAPHLPRTLQ